jgi:O-glycosyl hydrolase
MAAKSRGALLLVVCSMLLCWLKIDPASAQEAIRLPAPPPETQPALQSFSFVSDGPVGPGWSRPNEIARAYFKDELPALFRRTVVLSGHVPMHSKVVWIFTGPRAGFTVELTSSKVRLTQRFYDSVALSSGQGNYPQRTVHDEEQQYTGDAHTLTVVLDAHLSVQVLLNGVVMLKQGCDFDVLRHQMMFSAPRTEHLILSGRLLRPPVGNASIQVNPAAKHQTMLGFGGSPSIPAYEEMSEEGKRRYWDLLRRYNLLIDREYPMGSELKPDLSNMDTLSDAAPHYYGDNFPNGEVSDFAYSKRALALGGEVLYELWALPSWATQAYSAAGKPILDASNKPVRTAAKPEEYARIVVGYCRKALQRTGSAPAIVGVQNEVEEPPEIFAQMVLALRHALDEAGFRMTKIQMADASFLYLGTERELALRNTSEAWADIDYTASHEYDYQEFLANPDLYDETMRAMHRAGDGKPFLATEICVNDPQYQEPSYRIALNVGQLYQKNLTELDAEALLYCWLILDVEQPTFGGSRSLLVPDKTNGNLPVASSFQLRVLGAYSRHVLKGMNRVEASSSDADLLTAAFTDGRRSSVIVLNRSTEARALNVQWAAQHWTQIEHTNQRQENVVSNSLPGQLIVQPGEILTLSNFSVDAAAPAKE